VHCLENEPLSEQQASRNSLSKILSSRESSRESMDKFPPISYDGDDVIANSPKDIQDREGSRKQSPQQGNAPVDVQTSLNDRCKVTLTENRSPSSPKGGQPSPKQSNPKGATTKESKRKLRSGGTKKQRKSARTPNAGAAPPSTKAVKTVTDGIEQCESDLFSFPSVDSKEEDDNGSSLFSFLSGNTNQEKQETRKQNQKGGKKGRRIEQDSPLLSTRKKISMRMRSMLSTKAAASRPPSTGFDERPPRKQWTPAFRNMVGQMTPFGRKQRKAAEQAKKKNNERNKARSSITSRKESDQQPDRPEQDQETQADPSVFTFPPTAKNGKGTSEKNTNANDLKATASSGSYESPSSGTGIVSTGYTSNLRSMSSQESDDNLFGAGKLFSSFVVCGADPLKGCCKSEDVMDEEKCILKHKAQKKCKVEPQKKKSASKKPSKKSKHQEKPKPVHSPRKKKIEAVSKRKRFLLPPLLFRLPLSNRGDPNTANVLELTKEAGDSGPNVPKHPLRVPPKRRFLPPLPFRHQKPLQQKPRAVAKERSSAKVVTSSTSFAQTGAESVETMHYVVEKEVRTSLSHAEEATESKKRELTNGAVFNVRVCLGSFTGVLSTAIKRQSKGSSSNSLVAAYAHVDYSSSIATQTSRMAESVPITPDYSKGVTPLPPIAWSAASSDKTHGRVYFSVVLRKASADVREESYLPETVCLVVGLKRADEMIPLGLVSFTIDGTEVEGRRVDFAVQQPLIHEGKQGLLNFLRKKESKKGFREGDHVYSLGDHALLSARIDVRNEAREAPGPSLWDDNKGDDDSFVHSALVGNVGDHPQFSIEKSCNSVEVVPLKQNSSAIVANETAESTKSSQKKQKNKQTQKRDRTSSWRKRMPKYLSPQSEGASLNSMIPVSPSHSAEANAYTVPQKRMLGLRAKAANIQTERKPAIGGKHHSPMKTFFPPFMRGKEKPELNTTHLQPTTLGSMKLPVTPGLTAYTNGDGDTRLLTVDTNFSRDYLDDEFTASNETSTEIERSLIEDKKFNGPSWLYQGAKAVGLVGSYSSEAAEEEEDEDDEEDERHSIPTMSFSTKNETLMMEASDISESIATSEEDSRRRPRPTRATKHNSKPPRHPSPLHSNYRSLEQPGKKPERQRSKGKRAIASADKEASQDTLDEFKKILWISKKLKMNPDVLIDRLRAGEDLENLVPIKK